MSTLPKEYTSPKGLFVHVFGVSLFVYGILLLFSPIAFQSFSMAFSRYSFHVTMVFCIVLVVMAVSRTLLTLLGSHRGALRWSQGLLLCLAEIVCSSGFTALYLWLMSRNAEPYFWFFGLALVYLCVLMIIAYVAIGLYFIILGKNRQISDKHHDQTKERIRFFDERDNLKLVVAADAVLYVQSDENYVKVCYLEDGELKFCSIRTSMKRVEETCTRGGLIRCHRSYFVNSARVQSLQKDKEFTYAMLDVPNASRVPVSKNYYDQVAVLL